MPLLTPRSHPGAARAFTLIELLAVIAIVGVLAAIFVPVVSTMRESARGSQCSSNLRQLGQAFNLYAADNRGLFPAPRKSPGTPGSNPLQNSWQPEVSGYVIRLQSLGDVKKIGADKNIAHCPTYDSLFPDLKTLAATNYNTAGYGMNLNIRNDAGVIFNSNVRFPAAAIGKPANTILLADSGDYHIGVSMSDGWKKIPEDPMRPDGYNSGAPLRHGKTANYLFCDGRVQAMNPDAALIALNP